jgi:RecA/RadA recombinase
MHEGLSGSAYYIFTEGRFPARRFDQFEESFHERFSQFIAHHWRQKIVIHQISSAYEFIQEFTNIENFLALKSIECMPVRLIVVDSITALFRDWFAYNRSDFELRSSLLSTITKKLKDWARIFNLAVIVTNQVSTFIPSPNNNPPWEGLTSSGERIRPATALQRTGYVNARLFMWKEIDGTRLIRVAIRGPHFPRGRCLYSITQHGVFGYET